MTDHYELYYWPGLPGRGEIVRLIFAATETPYVDVAREQNGARAFESIAAARNGSLGGLRPFAPPVLRVGDLVLAQLPLIADYLGARLGLVPDDEAGRWAVRQLALTWCDVINEAHATHHPVSIKDYYHDQKPEALRAATVFVKHRLPMWLGYMEDVTVKAGHGWQVGESLSYVDLFAFQVLEGLRYAFPNAMRTLEPSIPALCALRAAVAAQPAIAKYLASPARMPFNEHGIFRHYPELDA